MIHIIQINLSFNVQYMVYFSILIFSAVTTTDNGSVPQAATGN